MSGLIFEYTKVRYFETCQKVGSSGLTWRFERLQNPHLWFLDDRWEAGRVVAWEGTPVVFSPHSRSSRSPGNPHLTPVTHDDILGRMSPHSKLMCSWPDCCPYSRLFSSFSKEFKVNFNLQESITSQLTWNFST